MVEKFPTVLEKLPQVPRGGDFFDSHCTSLVGPRRRSPMATNVVLVVVVVGVVVIR